MAAPTRMTVIRVKRKLDDEPVDVLSAKRSKTKNDTSAVARPVSDDTSTATAAATSGSADTDKTHKFRRVASLPASAKMSHSELLAHLRSTNPELLQSRGIKASADSSVGMDTARQRARDEQKDSAKQARLRRMNLRRCIEHDELEVYELTSSSSKKKRKAPPHQRAESSTRSSKATDASGDQQRRVQQIEAALDGLDLTCNGSRMRRMYLKSESKSKRQPVPIPVPVGVHPRSEPQGVVDTSDADGDVEQDSRFVYDYYVCETEQLVARQDDNEDWFVEIDRWATDPNTDTFFDEETEHDSNDEDYDGNDYPDEEDESDDELDDDDLFSTGLGAGAGYADEVVDVTLSDVDNSSGNDSDEDMLSDDEDNKHLRFRQQMKSYR